MLTGGPTIAAVGFDASRLRALGVRGRHANAEPEPDVGARHDVAGARRARDGGAVAPVRQPAARRRSEPSDRRTKGPPPVHPPRDALSVRPCSARPSILGSLVERGGADGAGVPAVGKPSATTPIAPARVATTPTLVLRLLDLVNATIVSSLGRFRCAPVAMTPRRRGGCELLRTPYEDLHPSHRAVRGAVGILRSRSWPSRRGKRRAPGATSVAHSTGSPSRASRSARPASSRRGRIACARTARRTRAGTSSRFASTCRRR